MGVVRESTYAMTVVARTAKKVNKKNSFMAKRYFARHRNTVLYQNRLVACQRNQLLTTHVILRSDQSTDRISTGPAAAANVFEFDSPSRT